MKELTKELAKLFFELFRLAVAVTALVLAFSGSVKAALVTIGVSMTLDFFRELALFCMKRKQNK